jgi:hypothetical protein
MEGTERSMCSTLARVAELELEPEPEPRPEPEPQILIEPEPRSKTKFLLIFKTHYKKANNRNQCEVGAASLFLLGAVDASKRYVSTALNLTSRNLVQSREL